MSFSKSHLLPYNQLTTARLHIQVLVLLKIAYFQEKVNITSVPIQPQIFTVNGPEVLSSASDKTKLFAENSNLEYSGISLAVFPSRTNLKLHNISVTSKMVKKVIMNLDLSKASGPDSIPVVVLKNCEPELSYILAELF